MKQMSTVRLLPQTELLSPSSAAHSWCSRPAALHSLWPGMGGWDGLLAARARIRPNLTRREAVGEALERQYQAAGISITTPVIESFKSGAAVVTVGHQLQAGGGPAYFHYKILSALRWTKQLQQHGMAAVTVFWLASEDHDLDEVSTTWGVHGEAFRWAPNAVVPDAPVGGICWDESAERDWNAWSQRYGWNTAQAKAPMLLSERVRHWVEAWFPGEPLLVVDGNDATLKALAAPLWRAEWTGSGIYKALMRGKARFEEVWGAAPLHPRENNLFVLDASGSRIRADRWMETRKTEPENHGAGLEPHQQSPNAALRPLYQEFLLQSVAFVGGPAEVSYWLMLGPAFEHHGLEHPALMMRDGAFIHRADTAEAALKAGWSPEVGNWTSEIAIAQFAERELLKLGDVDAAYRAWEGALEAYAKHIPGDAIPTTRAALARMEKELGHVKKKWRKLWRQEHAAECEALGLAFEQWIAPQGQMQERRVSALALLDSPDGWTRFKHFWFEALNDAAEPSFLVYQSNR